jgi:pSer/pThr/pTyr-binding forkhead associated (FHA) protein
MELKLIVLAGAKQGLEIPLKKDKFLIGRAKECSLRAGSEAISRRHCAIVRKGDRFTVRDLGSRNGTYVNDVRITEEVPLEEGNELRVGPLEFRVASSAKKKEAAPAKPSVAAAAPTPSEKPRKQPPVKDVADVIQRTVNKAASDSASEDDITRWLLGMPEDTGETNLKETLTFRMEETQAHGTVVATNGKLSADDVQEATAEVSENGDAATAEEKAETESKGGWGLFKRKGGVTKKQPGKLPPRPEQQTKDSREAAADILREMTRRR